MGKKKEQNNGLRMILFYLTCGVVVVTASFGGVYFTFSHLVAGITQNSTEDLEAAINFPKLEGAIWTQLPENLEPVKIDKHSKYANSADVVSHAPRIKVNAETFVELINKSGICSPDGSSAAFSTDACSVTRESTSYSMLVYKAVNRANPDIWVKFIVAKDESLIIWRVTSATLSDAMMARVLE